MKTGNNPSRRFISFGVTQQERDEILHYCRIKRRWKGPSALARDAVFQLMLRYPVSTQTVPGRVRNQQVDPGTETAKTSVGGTACGLVGQFETESVTAEQEGGADV